MANLTLVRDLLKKPEVQEWLTKLPNYLSKRVVEVDLLQKELEMLIQALESFGKRMPTQQKDVHTRRITIVERQLDAAERIVRAISLGYDPYTPPESWYGGFLDQYQQNLTTFLNLVPEKDWHGNKSHCQSLDLYFAAPIPAAELERYLTARDSGLFNQFLVVSPDKTHFESIPASVYADPVIVGYIATEGTGLVFGKYNEGDPKFCVIGGTGFLIAHWDLRKDRESAGLEF